MRSIQGVGNGQEHGRILRGLFIVGASLAVLAFPAEARESRLTSTSGVATSPRRRKPRPSW